MVDFLLIKPPYYDEGGELDLTTSLERVPPLGLGYVAASCKDFSVKILDMEAKEIKTKDIWQEIKKYSPKIIGITVISSIIEQVKKICKIIRKNSDIKIILGGPHAVLDPESLIEIGDYVVCGEAEVMINNFLHYLIYKKGNLTKIKNLVYIKDKKIIHTKEELIKNLDDIPFPKRELWDKQDYFNFFAKKRPYTSVITSRGCPYQCIYCTPIYHTVRRRSVENVIKEIKKIISEFNTTDIEFFDETFNLGEKWVIDFCKRIIEEKIKISWRARCRPDLVTEESTKMMKEAGCYMISLGVESANDSTLNFFNKGYNLKHVENAIRIIKKNRIELHAYFIIGSPTEDKRDTLNTINFSIRKPFDYVIFSILTPQPGTGLMQIALKHKWLPNAKIDYDKIKGYCYPIMNHPHLTKKEIMKLHKNATINFFIRPKRIMDILIKILLNKGIERKKVIKTVFNYLLIKR